LLYGNDDAQINYSVVFSNDLGQTWSTPKQLVNVTAGALSLLSVSADAEMSSSGAGYYYFSFYFGETFRFQATSLHSIPPVIWLTVLLLTAMAPAIHNAACWVDG
jgi:hypothetical protein